VADPARHDAYAALRLRDYRHLLAGGMLASIGLEVVALTVGWELYQRTGNPADLGYTGLAQFLPVLLLALPAGQAADRFSRKGIYQVAQSSMIAVSVGLATLSLGQGPVWLIFVLLVLAGISRAFSMPSRAALVPQLVPLEVLSNAVTWNSTGWQIANVIGPALGGLVIAVTDQAAASYGVAGVSFAAAYGVAALCFTACVVLLLTIQPRQVPPAHEARSLETYLAGARFVWQNKLLLAAITLDLFAVLLGGATVLLPIFARDILKVGPRGLGILRAAPALGAMVMAVVLAHRPALRRPGRALLLAVAGFGLATIGFGLATEFWLALLMLALTGALDNISIVVRHTLLQMLTPDSMRGRVSAVNSVFVSSSNELGGFESGITAYWFGPVISVVGGGIGTLVVVLAVIGCWPELWRLGPLLSYRAAPEEELESDLEERPSRPEGGA
jgi:MFS family permease